MTHTLSIRDVLQREIDAGQHFTGTFEPWAKKLLTGMTRRIENSINQQLTHPYQGVALLLKIAHSAEVASSLKDVRDARRDLVGNNGLNAKIIRAAEALAQLLRKRSEAESKARWSPVRATILEEHEPMTDDVIGWIDRAADLSDDDVQYRYEMNVKTELARLRRFDSKYWPASEDVIDAIADLTDQRRYLAADELGEIAGQRRQTCLEGDFVRLLDDQLSEIGGIQVGSTAMDGKIIFPATFLLSNECIADLLTSLFATSKTAKDVAQYRQATEQST